MEESPSNLLNFLVRWIHPWQLLAGLAFYCLGVGVGYYTGVSDRRWRVLDGLSIIILLLLSWQYIKGYYALLFYRKTGSAPTCKPSDFMKAGCCLSSLPSCDRCRADCDTICPRENEPASPGNHWNGVTAGIFRLQFHHSGWLPAVWRGYPGGYHRQPDPSAGLTLQSPSFCRF